MKDGIVLVYLGKSNKPIPAINFDSFEVSVSIFSTLPKGVLRLKDSNGYLLRSLKGLALGTSVRIEISEGEGRKGSFSFCELMIASIAEAPNNLGDVSGILEVLLVHPWEFFQDYAPHIYKGISNSEIIKKVLESNGSGSILDISDDSIENSDEAGSIPRYKCGIGDKDFILKNILPYTTINNSPALFWVGVENTANLHSISSLFANDAKCALAAFRTDLEVDEEFPKFLETYNLKNYFTFNQMVCKIGDIDIEKFLKPLRSKVFVEANLITGECIEGTSTSKVCIGKDNKKFSAAKTPFLKDTISASTDIKVLKNRSVEDQTRFLINTSSPYIENFCIMVTSVFNGDIIRVGDIVTVYIPSTIKGKVHWMSGKWLVSEELHEANTASGNKATSTLTLIRPSFLCSPKDTDLYNISEYYGVKH